MLNMRYLIENKSILYQIKDFMDLHQAHFHNVDMNLLFVEINEEKVIHKFASFIKKEPISNELIFVSQMDSMIFQLLMFQPLSFLRISCLQEDLNTLLTSLDHKSRQASYITIKSGNAMVRLAVENVIYIESFAHYLILHTQSAQYKTRKAMSEFLTQPEATHFLRCHKSYLVNTNYIKAIKNDEVLLSMENMILPIGRNYKKDFIETFQAVKG